MTGRRTGRSSAGAPRATGIGLHEPVRPVGRLVPGAIAAITAIALLAGCGGSDVTEPNAAGADVAAQADGSANSTETVNAGAGTGVAEAAGATTRDDTQGPGATRGSVATQQGAGGTVPNGATKASDKGAGGGKGGTAAAGGSASSAGAAAIEAMVTNSAIFGGKAVCKPATLSEVTIGNVSTLSGVLGELFSPVTPALETFVASQNACGGLNGHKIKFVQADDQGDPSTASIKIQDLILNQKVLAFVGNIQVLTVDAIVPTIKKYGIPVIGSDLTNNTWFTNPLMFPQGSPPQSASYGYLLGTTKYHGETDIGNIYCLEVPRACEQLNRAFVELASTFGATVKKTIQASITAPSYVQQCLEFKNAGVKALVMNVDAASQVRLARSCTQVGYTPKLVAYPLSVGNERQFLAGNKWLSNVYIPMGTFPWMADTTPAQKYYQAAIQKYNPGFATGSAASLGWTSGALLVAAAAGLSPTNPTSQQLVDALALFNGQKFTELGGLSGPKTFRKDGNPRVPYCLFPIVSNDTNTGWKSFDAKATCTNVIAPSDPQKGA